MNRNSPDASMETPLLGYGCVSQSIKSECYYCLRVDTIDRYATASATAR